MTIYFLNKDPLPDATMISEDTDISFDVTSTIPLNKSSLKIYVDGSMIFNGSVFLESFVTSELTDVNVGGNDGYNIILHNGVKYDNFVDVSIEVEDMSSNSNSTVWSFLIDEEINTLYFSDGYGAKKINVSNLVGESQFVVKTFLSTDTIVNIPHNSISSMYGNKLEDGYFYLAMSYDDFVYPDGYGIVVAKNEYVLDTYSDGYACFKGQITDDGKLYLINKDKNRIEVYYGLSEFFGVVRAPDFIYSSTSTPAIMAGEILSLHVVSGVSTKYYGGTRLYVGTENGLNRIECYDKKNPDGTPFGTDHLGISYSYTISSGSGTYKSIGGTIPRVTSISSDEENNVFMVVTQDVLGDGGVTQISLSTNRKIVFMNYAGGFVPSNTIRDIWGKGGS